MIEKHFTLSRKTKTPDSFFSIEPHELRALVHAIRIAETSLGKVRYGLDPEQKRMRSFRRSLFAVENIKKGEVFTDRNIRSIRPAGGLGPKYAAKIYGQKAKKNIKKGTPLQRSLIAR